MDLWWSSLKQRLTIVVAAGFLAKKSAGWFLAAAGFGKRDDAGDADDDAGQLKQSLESRAWKRTTHIFCWTNAPLFWTSPAGFFVGLLFVPDFTDL